METITSVRGQSTRGAAPAGWPQRADRPAPDELGDAARKFESLLLAQLIRTARREAAPADGPSASLLEMAEDQLAEVLAGRGGLGLAQTIVDQLGRRDPARGRGSTVNPGSADKSPVR